MAPYFLGQDPGTAVHCFLAFVRWCMGYPDQARSHAELSLSAGHQSAHVNTICYAELHVAIFAQWLGDVPMARRCTEALTELASEHAMKLYRLYSDMLLGSLSVAQGDDSDIHRFRQALQSFTGSGSMLYTPTLAITFASQLLRSGWFDEACPMVAEAQRLMHATGERWTEAEIHRVEGELYLHGGEHVQARTCYERAIEVAQAQNARSWELRATSSLAALLGEQGEKQRAHDLLAGIYDRFSEGLESHDLQLARSLLDQLA